MTGRTHDVAAFTALTFVVATIALPHISYGTAIVAFTANMIGGLTPDIDQPTADLWHKLPAGGLYSRLFTPFLGGHRYLSHSILGIILFGFLAHLALQISRHSLVVNQTIVWWSFMIGYISHLIMDTFTKEGVPWLFPIPMKFGIPPFALMRVKTGGLVERCIVFPGLIALTAFIFYAYHTKFIIFIHNYIR